MEWVLLAGLLVFIGAAAFFYFSSQSEMRELRAALDRQMLTMTQTMSTQLTQQTQSLNDSQRGYQQAVSQVHQQLGQLQEATRSMREIGKDISSLQTLLASPKFRGSLGEFLLCDLIKQVLPNEAYELQYAFKNGGKVDAVIKLEQGILPIDAKFPLENFKRLTDSQTPEEAKLAKKTFVQDVKKHVDAIASKYILPDEGTLEFALMYIPAENIYYEVIVKEDLQNENLSGYAAKKKIIPVSPNTFYLYLESVARGLKGMRIERSAQMILERLGQLAQDFRKSQEEFEKVGGHLNSAQSAYQRLEKHFSRLQNKLEVIEQNTPALPLAAQD